MAACELCIELGENCVKYYEFIRNPEKEEAAKKKADELRPMLRETMLEEQNAHLSYMTNFFAKAEAASLNDSERKAEIKRIHSEQPPSSGEEDDHPPRPPPKHKRRYRKPRTKKANKSD